MYSFDTSRIHPIQFVMAGLKQQGSNYEHVYIKIARSWSVYT